MCICRGFRISQLAVRIVLKSVVSSASSSSFSIPFLGKAKPYKFGVCYVVVLVKGWGFDVAELTASYVGCEREDI